jgi:dihydrodipicolinate synthase/N-acetylneuraminate lyase
MGVVDVFAGVKQMLAWMGLECGVPRSPLRGLTEQETGKLRHELDKVGFFETL